MRAIKLYMDGAMGSRGAWLLAPYADRPTDEEGEPWTGLATDDPVHELQNRYVRSQLAGRSRLLTHFGVPNQSCISLTNGATTSGGSGM